MDQNELAEILEQKLGGKPFEASAEAEVDDAVAEETPAEEAPVEAADEEGAEPADAEAPLTPEEELQAQAVAWAERNYGEGIAPNLARALYEKEQMIVRQAREVGAVRQEMQALRADTRRDLDNLRSEDFEPDEEWETWADEEIERGQITGEGDMTAIEAIVAAGQEGGPEAARYVLNRWHMKDPAAATQFQQQVYAMNDMVARVMEPDSGTPVASENGDPVARAWAEVGVRHPDVAQFHDAMQEAYDEMPDSERVRWESKIKADVRAGEDFVENLYLQAKARSAEARLGERRQASQLQQKRKADQEAIEATVASASASPPRSVPTPQGSRNFDREAFRREAGLTMES